MANIPVQILIDAQDKASGVFKSLGSNVKNSTGLMGGLKGATDAVGGAVFSLGGAIAGLGLGALAFDIAKSGAELERMETTLGVVADNMGYSNSQIEEFKTQLAGVNTFGRHATETITTFLQSGIAGQVEFEKFIGVTKDFAASMGVSSGDAIKSFTKAITTLRPELLEQFGIQFNLTQVYKTYAETLGKTSNELTAVEKRQALLNEVFKQGENVAGVYDKTYSTAGKNLLSIKDALTNVKDILGKAVNPAFREFTGVALNALKDVRKWFEANQEQVEQFATKLADGAKIVIQGLGAFINFLAQNKEIVIAFFLTLTTLMGIFVAQMLIAQAPVIAVVAGLTLLWWGVLKLIEVFKSWLPAMQQTFQGLVTGFETIKTGIITFFTTVGQAFMTGIEFIKQTLITGWEFIKEIFRTSLEIILLILLAPFFLLMKALFGTTFEEFAAIVQNGWNTIREVWQKTIETIQKATNAFIQTLINWWIVFKANMIAIWTAIKDFLIKLWETVKSAVMKIVDAHVQGVLSIFNALWNGLKAIGTKIFNAIVEPFQNALNKIREIAEKIKEAAKKISPFHRESPSLVDNVQNGLGLITDEYRKLKDDIEGMGLGLAGAGRQGIGVAGAGTTVQGGTASITVNVGMYAGNASEKRQIAIEIMEAFKQVASGMNMSTNELLENVGVRT